ncbi:MAG: mechanosensitive ion channel family protein [Opitutales bacterium]|nr:mechanosensitive ion channel family protein [Opitutales bacterium]
MVRTFWVSVLVVGGLQYALMVKGMPWLNSWMEVKSQQFPFLRSFYPRFKTRLLVLWGVIIGLILAQALAFNPVATLCKSLSSFLLCVVVGDVVSLVGLVGLGYALQNAEEVFYLAHKWISVLSIVVGLLMAINNLGYSIAGLLTALGIGGAALILAAQKTLADLLSAVSFVLTRPFHEGDWIVVGTKAAGRVESVGLRLTRVRTKEGTIVYIPNHLIASECVENKGNTVDQA